MLLEQRPGFICQLGRVTSQGIEVTNRKLTERVLWVHHRFVHLIDAAGVVLKFQPVFRIDGVPLFIDGIFGQQRANKKAGKAPQGFSEVGRGYVKKVTGLLGTGPGVMVATGLLNKMVVVGRAGVRFGAKKQ